MISELFPFKIYKTNNRKMAESLLQKLQPRSSEIWSATEKNNLGYMRNESLGSFNAMRNLHQWDETLEFRDFLMEHVREYWLEMDYYARPSIFHMWANRYSRHGQIEIHDHCPTSVATCFYLQKDPESGHLVFEHPMATLMKYQPYNACVNVENHPNQFCQEIPVQTGDLVLWPGYLKHKTTAHEGTCERIIISTNIVPNEIPRC